MKSQSEATPITEETREDLDIRDMLEKGEGLVGEPDSLVDWFLRTHALLDAEEKLITEQCNALVSRLKSRRKALLYKFLPMVETWAMHQLEKEGGRSKSVIRPHGTLQFRSVNATYKVDDAREFREWLDEQPTSIRQQLQDCFRLEYRSVTPLKEYIEETGEEDIPGVQYIPARQSMSIRHKGIIERGD